MKSFPVVVVFDLEQEVAEIEKAETAEGKLNKQYVEDKLMNSVLAGDKQTIEQAELIQEATNRSIGSFTPDLLMAQMVNNFSMARQLYGDKMIKLLTGYDPNYIERNMKIPEFKKELKNAVNSFIARMKDNKIVDEEGTITEKGAELGALVLVKELDQFIAKEKMGEKTSKRVSHYGEKTGFRNYKKGDRFIDLSVKRSVHRAIKRGRQKLSPEDLIIAEREGKGKISLILALDASASMKGNKIETCKRAGVALAHKAINEQDEVGLVVFGSEIKNAISPTKDLNTLISSISSVKTSRQTDVAAMIFKSIELFPLSSHTKHLIILTDALPTVGKDPEIETLQATSAAHSAGITVSIIGVQLDKAGVKLAEQIAQIGEGRFILVKNLGQLGQFILEDYYAEK